MYALKWRFTASMFYAVRAVDQVIVILEAMNDATLISHILLEDLK